MIHWNKKILNINFLINDYDKFSCYCKKKHGFIQDEFLIETMATLWPHYGVGNRTHRI